MKKNIEDIKNQIKKAAELANRNYKDIKLVAVTKKVSIEKIKSAIDAGLTVFGESYIQEAKEKINIISNDSISWHFIGHLQSNKAKYVVKLFDLIHSVDNYKLAYELDKAAKKINKIQNILIQVNISKEASKSGADINDVENLIQDIAKLKNISIKGLMTMPPFFDEPDKARPFFKTLFELSTHIKNLSIPNVAMQELSMGMSGDFEVAINEGATLVRVGTALFGKRN